MGLFLARPLTAALAIVSLLGTLPAAAQPASPAAAASAPAPAPALEWLTTTEQATAKVSGLRGDRARAIAWLAAFNALNAIEPRYREYAPAPAPIAAGGVRPAADAALAAAIYTTLALEADADQALLLRRYRESLAAVKSAPERDAGATLGQQAALLLLLARAGDRTGRVEAPPATPGPGIFSTSSYAGMPRSIAIIGIAPFGVRSVPAFDPGPPPAVGSAPAARDVAEVRALGGSTSSTRSGEQTAAALFWNTAEPGDFSNMVRPVLEARKLDTLDIVRILALDALIGIDGNIVNSVLKERYAHWRPEAAIAGPFAAAADAAKDWQGLVRSPNSPDYPSGAATGAGVIEVELPRLFVMNGPVELRNGQTGQLRRWPNAAALADEMGASRVWAGAHFRSAVEAGRRVGRDVATEILDRQLLPR